MALICCATPQRVLKQLTDAAIKNPFLGRDRLRKPGLPDTKFVRRLHRLLLQCHHSGALDIPFPSAAGADQLLGHVLFDSIPADRLRGDIRRAL